jgi:ABC-type multidrug transport system fused ATPase/permease subunit
VESVMSNSLHFFQSTPFGRIINRFSYDTSIVDKVWTLILAQHISAFIAETIQTTAIKHIKVSVDRTANLVKREFVVSENCHHKPETSAIYSSVFMCRFN